VPKITSIFIRHIRRMHLRKNRQIPNYDKNEPIPNNNNEYEMDELIIEQTVDLHPRENMVVCML